MYYMETKSHKNVYLKTRELTFFQKLLQVYWINPQSWISDEFILEDEVLTVKTKKGNFIQSSLSKISTKYSVDSRSL